LTSEGQSSYRKHSNEMAIHLLEASPDRTAASAAHGTRWRSKLRTVHAGVVNFRGFSTNIVDKINRLQLTMDRREGV
jgi:hypothetical protein